MSSKMTWGGHDDLDISARAYTRKLLYNLTLWATVDLIEAILTGAAWSDG